MSSERRCSWILAAVFSFLAVAWESSPRVLAGVAGKAEIRAPRGLPKVKAPPDNALEERKIELGMQLYFDPRLSGDNSVSCATCHDPRRGWSNGDAVATGIQGKRGARSSPTVLNSAYNVFQFWDGRAASLEEQVLGPIQNPLEMGMPSLAVLEEKLNAIPGYKVQFQKVFGEEVTAPNVAKAIAAFERTVLAGDSPYDRYLAGEKGALSTAARRGMEVFFNQGHCSACHAGPNFTDNAFHNIGIGVNGSTPDIGREAISKLEGDRGSFKTPTLRDIARTAPYMHDGSLKNLEAVIEHYNQGGIANPQLDEEIFPLQLTDQEKRDLITFLKEGLSSNSYPALEPPSLPE